MRVSYRSNILKNPLLCEKAIETFLWILTNYSLKNRHRVQEKYPENSTMIPHCLRQLSVTRSRSAPGHACLYGSAPGHTCLYGSAPGHTCLNGSAPGYTCLYTKRDRLFNRSPSFLCFLFPYVLLSPPIERICFLQSKAPAKQIRIRP